MVNSPAVFLDKDGTLIENVPYNINPTLIQLETGALDFCRQVQDCGYKLVVVSNQSGVARGYFQERELIRVKRCLRRLLAEGGATLSGFYYCPHFPEGSVQPYATECECRKPKPGMLLEAACQLEIDLSSSWLIGDILDDIEAGIRAGCGTILVDNGHETEWRLTRMRQPDFIVKNLLVATDVILNSEKSTLY